MRSSPGSFRIAEGFLVVTLLEGMLVTYYFGGKGTEGTYLRTGTQYWDFR